MPLSGVRIPIFFDFRHTAMTMYVSTELITAFLTLLAAIVVVRLFLILRRGPGKRRPEEGLETGGALTGGEIIARLEGKLDQIESISNTVGELASIFTIPRTRGEAGEVVLAELLRTYLPKEAFTLQYSFSDGRRVDAAVRIGSSLVPVDSKFPLEALRRHDQDSAGASALPASVHRNFLAHAKNIAERYIRPEEGTMDFALMYVPSEGVYHRVFVADPADAMRESLALRVVPVSPGTLFLYLLTVSYGLRGLAFSRERSELLAAVSAVRRDFGELTRSIELLRGHLKNATRAADDCDAKVAKIDRGLYRLEE